MIENLKWIYAGEREILYCDYRNLTDKALVPILKETQTSIENLGKNDLLLIFDVTDSYFNRESFSASIELGIAIKPYRIKSSFIGVKGAKKFLLDSILTVTRTNEYVQTFNDIEAAKNWLIE